MDKANRNIENYIQIYSQLREKYRWKVTDQAVFEKHRDVPYATVKEIAQYISIEHKNKNRALGTSQTIIFQRL